MSVAPPADQTSDVELLIALPHDLAAFEAFYDRFFARVTAFAARRCTSADDVADVVAQTFVRLLGAAERYEPDRAAPGAFVLGITANVVRELYRRGARQRDLVARLSGRDLLDGDDIERIDAAIDSARAARAMQPAIAAMPAGEQAVLLLVSDGRSPGQAADELGISPAAAWASLSRARRRLRRLTVDPREGER